MSGFLSFSDDRDLFGQATLAEGFVVASEDENGLLDVVIPSFDDGQKFNDLPYTSNGNYGPSLGARVLVARDNFGALWVIGWHGGNSDQEPPHGKNPTDPSGKSDNGSSAVDARGVAAPSSCEIWENVGSAGSYSAGELVPIAPWIKPVLEFAVDNGWDGTINEGWRSLETQQYYWDNAPALGLTRGVTVASPGSSNHGRLKYPGGAVDVNDTAGMAAAMRAYTAKRKLIWFGPKDTPHWSGNGR